MGQEFYICQSGTGGQLSPDQQEKMNAFIPCLQRFMAWQESGHRIVANDMSLALRNGTLIVLISDQRNFPKADVRELVRYARTIGLNLFVDIGDPECEMPLDEIEDMLGNMEAT